MHSYQFRSSNRQLLRTTQSTHKLQLSQCSRSNSKKKYLDVFSKNKTQLQSNNPPLKLSASAVSLPINFKQPSSTNQYHQTTYHNQLHLVPCRSMIMIPHWQSHQLRGNSLPAKAIIIQETVRPVPVNFSYLQPSTVRIDYRQSLPINIPINSVIPNKNEIVKNSNREAATPIRIFSNTPSNNINTRRNILTIDRRPEILSRPQNYQAAYQYDEIALDAKKGMTTTNINQSSSFTKASSLASSYAKQTEILSNRRYIQYEVKLNQIGVNTDLESGRKSRLICEGVLGQKKSNYNSLVVTQEDKEGNFKENLQLKGRECICEKIKNFSECSQIKINVKQVLKPKKNFVFV